MGTTLLATLISSVLSNYFSAPATWIAGVFGLVLGSFLNVCIFRIPANQFWSHARSHCLSCRQMIPFWLNIPVLSFVILRGKARCCGARLPWQYPCVELLTGVLLAVLYHKFPFLTFRTDHWVFHARDALRFGHATIFVSLLIVAAVIDLRSMIIPDRISLSMIALTPLVIALHPELSWQSGLFGVLLGGGVIYGIAWTYYLLRKREGIGMGDAKLLAGIGGWLGYQSLFPTMLYGSVIGTLVAFAVMAYTRKISLQREIPFGPFLALGAVIHLLI